MVLALIPLVFLVAGSLLLFPKALLTSVDPKCFFAFVSFSSYLFWRQVSSSDAYLAKPDTIVLLGSTLCYFSGAVMTRSRTSMDIFVLFLMATGLIQVFLTIGQVSGEFSVHPLASLVAGIGLPGTDGAIGSNFASGTFFSRSGLSPALSVVGFFLLSLALWGRGGTGFKILLLWVAGVSFCGVFLSGSRAGTVGVGVGIAFFFLISFIIATYTKGTSNWVLTAFGFLLSLAPLWIFGVVIKNSHSFQLAFQKILDDPYRENLWSQVSPYILALSPWTGAGAGAFSHLALRYRTPEFWGNPVYAHNEWLQLLLDYGAIGLAGGIIVLGLHLLNCSQSVFRSVRALRESGVFPQSNTLGYLVGAGCSIVAISSHIFFDYSLHIPYVAWLTGFMLGVVSVNLKKESFQEVVRGNINIGAGLLGTGILLFSGVAAGEIFQSIGSESKVLGIENCQMRQDPRKCLDLVDVGLIEHPAHPRMNRIKGDLLFSLGAKESSITKRANLFRRASESYRRVVEEGSLEPGLLRQAALSLSLEGQYGVAEKIHIFAISRDPCNALGYQYLASHFQLMGRSEDARRLSEMAKTLPGNK